LADIFRQRKPTLLNRIETRVKLIHRKQYMETENEDFSFSNSKRGGGKYKSNPVRILTY